MTLDDGALEAAIELLDALEFDDSAVVKGISERDDVSDLDELLCVDDDCVLLSLSETELLNTLLDSDREEELDISIWFSILDDDASISDCTFTAGADCTIPEDSGAGSDVNPNPTIDITKAPIEAAIPCKSLFFGLFRTAFIIKSTIRTGTATNANSRIIINRFSMMSTPCINMRYYVTKLHHVRFFALLFSYS